MLAVIITAGDYNLITLWQCLRKSSVGFFVMIIIFSLSKSLLCLAVALGSEFLCLKYSPNLVKTKPQLK